MAYFAYVMMINLQLSTTFPSMTKFNETMKSGWKHAYDTCGFKYVPYLHPQNPGKPKKRKKQVVSGSIKHLKSDMTEIDY